MAAQAATYHGIAVIGEQPACACTGMKRFAHISDIRMGFRAML